MEPKLSPRELEIAAAITEGLAQKEIGRKLGISQQTVHNHLRKIYEKLQVKGRVGLALWYSQQKDS